MALPPLRALAALLALAAPLAAQTLSWHSPELELRARAGLTELLVEGDLVQRTERAVLDARALEAEGNLLVTWDERAPGGAPVHHYRVRSEGRWSRVRATSYEIVMQRERFDPALGAPALAGSALAASGELYIVQFWTPPLEAFRREITSLGGRVHHFFPNHAHLVRMDARAREAVAALPYVRWVGPYHAEYRLEGALRDALASGELGTLRYRVQVLERGPAMKGAVAERVRAAGGQVVLAIPDGFVLEAVLTPEQLVQVATWDEVLWIDRWAAPEDDMNIVRNDGGANALETATGFTGQGVRGEVMDGNVDDDHVDLPSIVHHGSNSGAADHGTPVSGIVFGKGIGNGSGRGLLPDGQPIFADYGFLTNRYTHTAQLLQSPYFACFQTNSWGSGLTTSYNSTSMEMDDILFDHDIVILQSQSNTGDQFSRPQAWAKNIVAVGGIVHNNTLSTADDHWTGSGSIGPAQDGRIKPDLCYWYDSIFSPADGGGYTQFGGTSAATPETAGHFGLFYQMWHENLFGTNPGGASVFDSRPKATTARAMVINTASAYNFSGTADDLTRTHQGWGRASIDRMYDRHDRFFVVDETDVLQPFEVATYCIEVAPEDSNLRVTLVYLDPPGTTSAGQHRINDLSLRVTDPFGTQYWGNNGLDVGRWSTSGGFSNTKDVVENVFVQTPPAGAWTLEVFADEINQDGHVETGALDVDFALVASPTAGPSANCAENLGTRYCDPGAINSSGLPGLMLVTGSDVVADDDLTLTATQLPSNSNIGYFLMGTGTTVTVPPGSDGPICVTPGLQRFLPPVENTNELNGGFTRVVGTSGPVSGNITAGTTWNFQAWHRDFNSGSSNLTDAISVTFQ